MGNTIRSIKLLFLLLTIFSCISVVFANSFGAPASNTGAPGEGTCNSCHSTNPLNTGGSVTISGLPQTYTTGTRYNLTVKVAKNGASRWGFQVVAITDDGASAGTLTVTNTTNTQMTLGSVSGKTRNYITHTTSGTQRGVKDTASFTFDWVAPATNVGKVTFYVAGNAANGDGTLGGDNIYTTKQEVAAAAPAGPSLNSLSPVRGPADGGTTVTLTGANFKNGSTTTFDGLSAPTTFVNDTTVKVVTPPHAAGPVDVMISNPDGQTARLRGSFTYEAAPLPAPILTGVTPDNGPTAGGTTITLSGNNFVPGLTLMVGARQALMVSVTSTQVTAQTPPNNPGPVNIVLTNPDGQVVTLTNAFTFTGDPLPTSVTLMTPNGGEVLSAGGFPFIINWMQMSGPTASQRLELSTDGGNTFNTTIADNLTADKSTFTYSVPAGISSSSARIRISIVENGVTITDVSDQNFTIVAAPTITNIAPKVGATIKLKITGTLFKSGVKIEVNGNPVATTFKSATSLIGKKIDRALAGTQIRVRIINPDGGISREMLVTP